MATSDPVVLDGAGLRGLVDELRARGYRVVGPTVGENAIVLAELDSVDDLPHGWGVDVGPGTYRLRRRDDAAAFGHSAGPQSWKQFLHPPR
ncbi:MAG: 4Fe-4S ferredoxin, partial [Mycobacterium sp.]|nr:4Fe-4S ferredoxin [Mycobacterium sp.]